MRRIFIGEIALYFIIVSGLVEGCGNGGLSANRLQTESVQAPSNSEDSVVNVQSDKDTKKPKVCDFQVGWTHAVRGGLGGEIVKVTTLDPTGPGSLKEAIDKKGARVVIFEVGGTIDLENQSLLVKEPFITIAGQTAPEPGITIKNGELVIATHDVVAQHIRVRPGQGSHGKGWQPDGISLEAAYNVIIDHCSISWAIDENLSASGPRFEGKTPDEWRRNTSHTITFSNNIVAEGLNKSTHPYGKHSKGSLIHDNVTEVLIYENLYASNSDRNPLFKGGSRGAIVNNYIYNSKRYGPSYALIENEWGTLPRQVGALSLVGNVFQAGPDTSIDKAAFFNLVFGPLVAYLDDNIALDMYGNDLPMLDEAKFTSVAELPVAPFWPPGLEVHPSENIEEWIRNNVGARPWARDDIDKRIVRESFLGVGKVIDSEEDVGGYLHQNETYSIFDPMKWDECFNRKE